MIPGSSAVEPDARSTPPPSRGVSDGPRRQHREQGRRARRQAKESAGKATGDSSLAAEGKTDQASSNLKQAGENVKDIFNK
jgi:uncharacterized protein YjbJ (UPF0337 family)